MGSVLATEAAKLAEFKFTRSRSFVFCCRVVSLLALCATKCDDVSHKYASFCMKSADTDGRHAHIRFYLNSKLFNN